MTEQIVIALIASACSAIFATLSTLWIKRREKKKDNSEGIAKIAEAFPVIMAGHKELSDLLMNSDRSAWDQRRYNLIQSLNHYLNGGKKPHFLE